MERVRILSIDGGGVRGLISGRVVLALEELLQQRRPGTRIADHFDLVAGTSAGGIMACLLLAPDPVAPTRPRYSAEHAVRTAKADAKRIFPGQRFGSGVLDEKYDSDGLEEVLAEQFPDDLMLADLLRPTVITAYDTAADQPYFFKQHRAGADPDRNHTVRQVARATSAAPTYFEAALVASAAATNRPLVDGGVFANNPAMCAYAEAVAALTDSGARDMAMLSIGTGVTHVSHRHDEIRDWGLVQWAKPLLNILLSGVSDTVDHQLAQLFSTVDQPTEPSRYLRLQADLSDEAERGISEMDNTTDSNLERLEQIGDQLVNDRRDELTAFVDAFLV